MTKILPAILIMASLGQPASAPVAQRPKVPEERSTVSLGVDLGEPLLTAATCSVSEFVSSLAAATAGLSAMPCGDAPAMLTQFAAFDGSEPSLKAATCAVSQFASSLAAATAGLSAMQSPDAAAKDMQPAALDGDEVDGGRFMRLVLSCEDDQALRDRLTAAGLTLREGNQVRKLPDFVTAVACSTGTAFSREDSEALEKVAPPSGVRVLRFVDRSSEAADYAAAHADEKFIVIAQPSGLSVKALKALAGQNVVAVVVGHYSAADLKPEHYGPAAQRTLAAVKAIRLVSDAPVLLAVSATNLVTRKTEKSWPEAFGDGLAGFDGWAVYNLSQFPAILEAPSNPRKLIMERLALADKPCLLMEFVGTNYTYKPADADYIRKVWKAKAPLLLKALADQGWRGLVVRSPVVEDAKLKAEVLRGN